MTLHDCRDARHPDERAHRQRDGVDSFAAPAPARTPTIAACMIVRNGAQTIQRCLAGVRPHVDEVCIYLGGESTDATVEILARLATEPGAPIFVEQGIWNDDYAAARNASFAMASSDYLAWFDDDEIVQGGENLRGLVVDDELLVVGPGCGWRPRVVRSASGASWRGRIHERLELPDGARTLVVNPRLLRVTHDPVAAEFRHVHAGLMRQEHAAGDTFQGFLQGIGLLDRGYAEQAVRLFEEHDAWLQARNGRDDDRQHLRTLDFLVTAYLRVGDRDSAAAAWRERLQMMRQWRRTGSVGESPELAVEFYLIAEASSNPVELVDCLTDRGLRLSRGQVVEDPRLDDLEFVAATVRRARTPRTPVKRNDPCSCGSQVKFKKCCALPLDLDELSRRYGVMR